jgi:hypothetical protein
MYGSSETILTETLTTVSRSSAHPMDNIGANYYTQDKPLFPVMGVHLARVAMQCQAPVDQADEPAHANHDLPLADDGI